MKPAVISLLMFPIFAGMADAQLSLNANSSNQMVMTNISAMPLSFTENRGQWDPQALYKAEAGGAVSWFCKDEVVYQFRRDTKELLDNSAMKGREFALGQRRPAKFSHPRYRQESLAIHVRFIGANPDVEIYPEDRLSYNCNYFIGNIPAGWHVDVPNYAGLVYKDLYPGIDLKFHGNGAGMKYDFIIVSGSDISQIRIRYDGAENLTIAANGELEATTLFGPVHENIPETYQEIDGKREEREGRYILRGNGIYGFEVEDYDPNYPLVIDPQLVYSTYLGGNFLDCGWGISVDKSGAAYVTGSTQSQDFPAHDPNQSYQGEYDAFITKFSAFGNSLVYSTYLGGSSDEGGQCVWVGSFGAAYITGETYSSNFPIQNPFRTDRNNEDAFVTKFGAYTGINGNVPPPSIFSLSQNYPNPFNSSTAISFDLPLSSHVTLALFDILGRKVETLIDGGQSAGRHEVIWDATELPSGIYFYKIKAGEFIEIKKMLMVK